MPIYSNLIHNIQKYTIFYKRFYTSYFFINFNSRLRTRGSRGIDLESIGAQAEGIFGTCEESEVLDLDGNGGKTFLRVLLHLGMHDYPPLVSGALHLLFRHFSQRQEVLQAFKQVNESCTEIIKNKIII